MKDKLGIMLGIAVMIMVLFTMGLWVANVANIEDLGAEDFIMPIIIIVLVGFAMLIVKDKISNVRQNLPSDDERIRMVNYKAGYYGFIAAIWSAVFGPTLYDIIYNDELRGGLVTATVVLVGGFTFVISFLILQSRGDAV